MGFILCRFFQIAASLGLTLPLFLVVSLPAFANDSKTPPNQTRPAQQEMTRLDASSDVSSNFAPEGLMREVMDLMIGIRRPIDDSTSVTFQAGTGIRVGLSF